MKYNEVGNIEQSLILVRKAVEVGNCRDLHCAECPVRWYQFKKDRRCGSKPVKAASIHLRNKIIKAFQKWIELVENKEITQ